MTTIERGGAPVGGSQPDTGTNSPAAPEAVAAWVSQRSEPGGAITVPVALGARSYAVHIGSGLDGVVATMLPAGCTRVAVVADRSVLGRAGRVSRALRAAGMWTRVIGLRGGEPVKSWAQAGALVRRLSEARLGREDCVVAVGGGTIGDLAGFGAAVYLRGIAVVHVPTTLLAMVDSAVGGKTGVNLPGGKNLAGVFWQPRGVVCDLDALQSLPVRAYRSAFAEVVKCSMIADAQLAALLDEQHAALMSRDPVALAEVVRRCCAVKAAVVSEDEREAGRRAILNYGHTVGHALEALSGYGDRLWHGEAVAAGMRVAGALSRRVLDCPGDDVAWQDQTLGRFGLGEAPHFDAERILERTRGDKKARAGSVRWVLVHRRGEASGGHALDDDMVRTALREVLAA